MIKITREKLLEGIQKAIDDFERDCRFLQEKTEYEKLTRINVLEENRESAKAKISTILWVSEYEKEIKEIGFNSYYLIDNIYTDVFDEIMYKNK